MKITANENGIVIKKLFKEVEIPYGSIEKIVIEDTNILRFRIEKAFNTKLMYDKEIGYTWKGKPTVSVREKCCTEDNQKKMELTQVVIEHFAMETI